MSHLPPHPKKRTDGGEPSSKKEKRESCYNLQPLGMSLNKLFCVLCFVLLKVHFKSSHECFVIFCLIGRNKWSINVHDFQVYAVASEDMDSLTFGAPRFLRHLMDPSSKKIPVMEFEMAKVPL